MRGIRLGEENEVCGGFQGGEGSWRFGQHGCISGAEILKRRPFGPSTLNHRTDDVCNAGRRQARPGHTASCYGDSCIVPALRSHPASDGCLVDTSQPSNRHADDDMGSQGGKHKKYEGPEFITYGMLSQHFNESLSTACEKLGFSRSAIKAACRRLGISKWPYSHSGPRMSKKKKEVGGLVEAQDVSDASQFRL
eukprot:765120-Hanusia_phi.AAC.2